MLYLSLKYVHLISMVLLFGTGLGSAWYRWMADRSGDVAHIATVNRHVVLADWMFTTPTVIIQPLTGYSMVYLMGLSIDTAWISSSLVLYLLAGACWIPVVWLQLRLRELSQYAYETSTELPARYWSYARIWFWLGVPAFIAMLMIVFLMIFKPAKVF